MFNLHYVYRKYDSEEIERLSSEKKSKARKKLIKKFLIQTYRNNFVNLDDPKDIFLVKNSYKFFKLALLMACGVNLFCYKFLFTGIYEIRSFYLNPKKLPFLLKFTVSSSIALLFLNKIWSDYVYMPEIYKLAVENNKNV